MLKRSGSKACGHAIAVACLMALAFALCTPVLAKSLYVKGNSVNIRSGPGTDTKVVTKLNQGHALEFVERKGRWLKIVVTGTDGKEGWIREDLVSEKPLQSRKAEPALKPPSVAELSTPAGVVAALSKAPRDRVLEAFRVAIKAANKPCDVVQVLSRVKAGSEGVYYYVECSGNQRYSVLVKPDGKMGTKVTPCPRGQTQDSRDLCKPA